MQGVRGSSAAPWLIGAVMLGATVLSRGGDPDPASSGAPPGRVPEHTIIVKGAWPSASDSTTPLPEGGRLVDGSYRNDYFGLGFRFSARWQPGLEGPPPSDGGSYTLAQIVPAERFRAGKPGYLLISAQDLFFSATRAGSALELVNFTRDHLDSSIYQVEQPPEKSSLAGHTFIRFAYRSPSAGMHWTILAAEIRCHIVEFVFVSTDPRKVAELLQAMDTIALPASAGVEGGSGGGEVPVCIRGYASPENLIEREEPVLTERRFNSIPVRVIIDRQGAVRHIHFLRAFPDQARAITDALLRWRFKPYAVDGRRVEVETGIVFGGSPQEVRQRAATG